MSNLILLISCIQLLSCQNQESPLEIKDIILSNKKYLEAGIQNASSHKKNQNGHYKYNNTGIELIESGEITTIYTFEGEDINNLNFYNQTINKNFDVKIIFYDNNLAFLSFKLDNSNYENYIKDFVNSLSVPDSAIIDNRISNAISNKVISSILKNFKGLSKIIYTDNNTTELEYPKRLFYTKDDLFYNISMDPLDGNINLKIEILSKDALCRNLILGYRNR